MNNKPQPTDFENQLAQARLGQLDKLSPKCAWHKHACECNGKELKARALYRTIMQRQQAYEEAYC